MRRSSFLSLAVASCVWTAIFLASPGPARAQTVSSPSHAYAYVQPYPYAQPRYYIPGNPIRGTVVGPSYVGPWYTYAARPFRPRALFRQADPSLEYGWPTGRGVPLAKPRLAP
jgi:hypothetical protein